MDLGRRFRYKAKSEEWQHPLCSPLEARVAVYFFNLADGHEVMIDPDGREIADPSEIATYALKEARAMISQDALGGRIDLSQYIQVRDKDGRLVHQLSFRDAVTIN